jgi:hypothetical protein
MDQDGGTTRESDHVVQLDLDGVERHDTHDGCRPAH